MSTPYQQKLGQELLKEVARQRPDMHDIGDLLRSRADTSLMDREGNTVLLLVISWGNEELVRQIIKNGADVNHRGTGGNTALHTAVATRNRAIIQLLIESGADASIANAQGKTPVDYADGWNDARLAKSVREKFNKATVARKHEAEFKHAIANGMPVHTPFQPMKKIKLKSGG